jgi:hypothetical protein
VGERAAAPALANSVENLGFPHLNPPPQAGEEEHTGESRDDKENPRSGIRSGGWWPRYCVAYARIACFIGIASPGAGSRST